MSSYVNLIGLKAYAAGRLAQYTQQFGSGPQTTNVTTGQSIARGTADRDFLRQVITGGYGTMFGNAGDDYLVQNVDGSNGSRPIFNAYGQDGNDTMFVSAYKGYGLMTGGNGNDRMELNAMDLTLPSGAGGDSGNDIIVLRNVTSAETLATGRRSSRLDGGGGAGNDTLNASANNASVLMSGEGGDDRLIVNGNVTVKGTFIAFGGEGNDTVELLGTGWTRDDQGGQAQGYRTSFRRADGSVTYIGRSGTANDVEQVKVNGQTIAL